MSWHGGWIEMGGAGMVDPNVLPRRRLRSRGVHRLRLRPGHRAGLRPAAQVTDIREFYKNDVRFLHQF